MLTTWWPPTKYVLSAMGASVKWSVALCAIAACALIIVIPLVLVYLRWHYTKRKAQRRKECGSTVVAFFHPYCNAGGGGERVLWCAVHTLQLQWPDIELYVYTGDVEASPGDIVKRVKQVFNIEIAPSVQFVYLQRRRWLEASRYPVLTLLGQAVGSIWLGLEALSKLQPDVYIETTGFAFTMPLFRYLCDSLVACYVHYPTVTAEMSRRVQSGTAAYNNRGLIARSPLLTAAKLLYYRLFAWAYGAAGRSAHSVLVNSTWTEEHVNRVWAVPLRTHRVYPPCDVDQLKRLPHEALRSVRIVSVGQFRPEKDHPLQLRALYELRGLVGEELWRNITLVFVGSCRGEADRARVRDMQDLCRHLALEANVEFRVNVPHAELLHELSRGLIGLHAMWNEHFGIGVVECMAAGLITVAHRSGGPLADIVETAPGCRNGFLAATSEEYALAIRDILAMSRDEMAQIRGAARASVDRFSTAEFCKGFVRAVEPLITAALHARPLTPTPT